MDVFLVVLRIIYIIILFIAVFISLKFEMGEENKDERGKSISNKSYGIVFPLMPLGWLLIELYDQFIQSPRLRNIQISYLVLNIRFNDPSWNYHIGVKKKILIYLRK